ncbi:VOC family protein [Nocardioides sp. zg-536]|uniref:VOC family protein n=1 Tax=Nocardioides faecalis TaxID=2803858 RepID=A0A938YB84_9ACTN|nr:VOC family protein [Nocardioides faecalis]MBM9461175.1 VOC family protein [Nocardioides faecalis]QVI59024.1 VOC family protein [Nocardioides faecalis]
MNATFAPGEPVWVELSCTDPAAAEAFYADLLGWEVRHEQLGDSVYRMCSLDGRDVAGISEAGMHGGRPHGWITYFAVDDIEQATRTARSLGGEVLTPPRHLPAAGHGASVLDPHGAVLGLYQGVARAGVEALNGRGALCWNELDTGEPEQSLAFYGALFGFASQLHTSATGRPYRVLTIEDRPVAGLLELESTWPNLLPSKWITYFGVDSLEQAVDRAVALGGTAGRGPLASPYGRLHLVRDSGGHSLCLIELEADLRPAHPSTKPTVTR